MTVSPLRHCMKTWRSHKFTTKILSWCRDTRPICTSRTIFFPIWMVNCEWTCPISISCSQIISCLQCITTLITHFHLFLMLINCLLFLRCLHILQFRIKSRHSKQVTAAKVSATVLSTTSMLRWESASKKLDFFNLYQFCSPRVLWNPISAKVHPNCSLRGKLKQRQVKHQSKTIIKGSLLPRRRHGAGSISVKPLRKLPCFPLKLLVRRKRSFVCRSKPKQLLWQPSRTDG